MYLHYTGELNQLSGLSLASNPLSSPPASVVQRGTRAVLHYLQDQLARKKKEREKEKGREADNWENGNTSSDSGKYCTQGSLVEYSFRVKSPLYSMYQVP